MTLVPFILMLVTIMHYVIATRLSVFRFGLRDKLEFDPDFVPRFGHKLLMYAYKGGLDAGMRLRLKWAVVRACIVMLVATALPSLMGLLSLFDCVPVEENDEIVWLIDSRRDTYCFDGVSYWAYAVLHMFTLLVWFGLIVIYVKNSKAGKEDDSKSEMAKSYQVSICLMIFIYSSEARF